MMQIPNNDSVRFFFVCMVRVVFEFIVIEQLYSGTVRTG